MEGGCKERDGEGDKAAGITREVGERGRMMDGEGGRL